MEEKIRDSNFLITINSNKTDSSYNQKLKDSFETFYVALEEFLIFKDGGSYDKVLEIWGEGCLETGSKIGEVHLHALICIKHTTNVHLNFKEIRSFFGETLEVGPTAFHLDVKVVRGQQDVRNYLRKMIKK